MKSLGILMSVCLCLLGACQQEIMHVTSGELKILTVEFSSGAPLTNTSVTLFDAETKEVLSEQSASIEGEFIFHDLIVGKEYTVHVQTENAMQETLANVTVKDFIYQKERPVFVIQTHAVNQHNNLAVPVVLQNPELPHGCEITSLTAVLNYYGVEVSKTEMADDYLPKQAFKWKDGVRYGPDPQMAFAGDPRDRVNGTYVLANPLVDAALAIITKKQVNLNVSNLSGYSPEAILNTLEQGIPVVLWVTLDLSVPIAGDGWYITETNEYHQMFKNLHAVVLVGRKDDSLILMNPLHGIQEHNQAQVFKSYQQLGAHAVAIHQ
ncbi:C39 family peptidase [Solibacillus sp. FSL H8-0538]|uniref:C39 family peptidase n=1 Tax=Solibacillus sp. FSL H8-0538 TaxID=2921400 RepID=UPI0030F79DC6